MAVVLVRELDGKGNIEYQSTWAPVNSSQEPLRHRAVLKTKIGDVVAEARTGEVNVDYVGAGVTFLSKFPGDDKSFEWKGLVTELEYKGTSPYKAVRTEYYHTEGYDAIIDARVIPDEDLIKPRSRSTRT